MIGVILQSNILDVNCIISIYSLSKVTFNYFLFVGFLFDGLLFDGQKKVKCTAILPTVIFTGNEGGVVGSKHWKGWNESLYKNTIL